MMLADFATLFEALALTTVDRIVLLLELGDRTREYEMVTGERP